MCRILPLIALLLVPCNLTARADEPLGLAQALQTLKPRSIGPANMSGRIVDVAVYEKEPRIQYIASATGGLWKTSQPRHHLHARLRSCQHGLARRGRGVPGQPATSSGSAPARAIRATASPGATASIAPPTAARPGITSASKDTHHIGRIVLHPTNPDIAYVAALGQSVGAERGARPVQDHRRRQDLVARARPQRPTPAASMSRWTRRIPTSSTPPPTSVRRDAFSGGNPDSADRPRRRPLQDHRRRQDTGRT